MSHTSHDNFDFDLEYPDESEDFVLDEPNRIRHKNRIRNRIEHLVERKRLRQMMDTDDMYWGEDE